MENAIDFIEWPLPVLIRAEVPLSVCAVSAIGHLRGVSADLTNRAATFAKCRRSDRQIYLMAHYGTTEYASARMPLEPLLTVTAVCGLLAISKQTVYRLIRAGELKPTRVGDRLRFEPEDVRAYVERHREAVGVP